jgi:hypothetical protein
MAEIIEVETCQTYSSQIGQKNLSGLSKKRDKNVSKSIPFDKNLSDIFFLN